MLQLIPNTKAQNVIAKDILAKAAKALLDKENITTPYGTVIQGRCIAMKMSKGKNEYLQNSFYAKICKLEISYHNYGMVRSGKFLLFFKDSRQGLKLEIEEKGSTSNIFWGTQTTPENYRDTKGIGIPVLAFCEPLLNKKV